MSKVVLSHPNFVEDLRLNNGLTANEADAVMRTVYNTITNGLLGKNQVRLINIGTFKLASYGAHKARDPRNGQMLMVPRQTILNFKTSRKIKEQIKDLEIAD